MRQGVVLYGPPGAGKDTVADALKKKSGRFKRYRLLKAGDGNQDGYRMTTVAEIEAKSASGDLLWKSERYGSNYAIDKTGFDELLKDEVVVVQLGQADAVESVKVVGIQWLVVSLWCSRAEAERRLVRRGGVDVIERLAVWDETKSIPSDYEINTESTPVNEIVHTVVSALGV